MKINYKIGKILVLLGVATLFYGCTTTATPMHYKKLPHKFTQTADGHIIKQYRSPIVQKDIVVFMKNGKRDGPRRRYDINDGKIVKEEIFKNDVLHGDITTYHKNGKLSSVMPYKNGKRDGVYKDFDENGKLIATKTYKDDHSGYGVERYSFNGYLLHIRNYKNGRRDGRSREWFSKSDVLESDTMYKEDSRHGMQKVYLNDGSLKYVVKYEYGQRVGELKQYDKKGKLEYVVAYHSGSVWKVVRYLPNGETLDVDIGSIFMTDNKGVVKYAK